jgi:hypothetical protein
MRRTFLLQLQTFLKSSCSNQGLALAFLGSTLSVRRPETSFEYHRLVSNFQGFERLPLRFGHGLFGQKGRYLWHLI